MDLDSFLVSLYVLVDDWWRERHPPSVPNKLGRPALLCESEVLTPAILSQWPRFRSERDFWRFACSHLRPYFPKLCTQGQLNRRIRALQPELRLLQRDFAEDLAQPSAVYRVMDTTLVPAMVRVRASGKGLFCAQASFGRSASKTEWVYGFKAAVVVDPNGVVTAFGLAPAASEERPIGKPWWRRTTTMPTWPTRASRASSGSGAGWRSTGRWWQPPRRTTPAGRGRRLISPGHRASARSSRG